MRFREFTTDAKGEIYVDLMPGVAKDYALTYEGRARKFVAELHEDYESATDANHPLGYIPVHMIFANITGIRVVDILDARRHLLSTRIPITQISHHLIEACKQYKPDLERRSH